MKKIFIRILMYSFYSIFIQISLCNLLLATTPGNAQETSSTREIYLNLELDHDDLLTVFNKIEQLTDFNFVYNSKDIDRGISLKNNYHNTSLYDILIDISRNTKLAFKRVNTNINVRKLQKGQSATVTEEVAAINVSGTVTSQADGAGLPGVNVLVKNTNIGTVTDVEGNFSITVPNEDDTLVFSSIGYTTQEVAVNGRTTVNVTLVEDVQSLEEVVVVGYGEQKKVNLTGSLSTVDSKQIEGQPSTNPVAMLQGRMPGVYITQSSGQPGKEGINVLVRGLGTMNNSRPMVLIDGLEASMSDINPNDIENITVLKDAAASAIYGTRAANGVILVTTKRGKGEPNITYNTHFGVQKPTRLPRPLSSSDYARLLNEGYINEGKSPVYTDDEIRKFETGEDPFNYPNTDWMDLLFQGSGLYHNHDLSFSGGNDKSSYRISMEYFNQKGLIERTDHKRYNLRVNLDNKIFDWFRIGLNSNLKHNDITEPVSPYSGQLGNMLRVAIQVPASAANKNEDGTWRRWAGANPISWVEEGGSEMLKNTEFLGSVFGEVDIMEGLTLKGLMGTNYNIDDNKNHIRSIAYNDGYVLGPNSVTDFIGRKSITYLQSYANYEKRIQNHDVKVMLGTSLQSEIFKGNTAFRNNFPSNDLNQLDVGSVGGMSNSGNSFEVKLGSYFGRVNYIFNEKYLLEMNARIDGSSKFARAYRWGTFPSFSAGWRISEENFMKNITWIDNLKLRLSWGKLGNHNIGDYMYIPRMALGANYPFDGTMLNGVAQTVAEVADISWETTTEFDIGIDADLYEGKVLMSIDYYDRFTDDILTSIPVSVVFGLPDPVVNAGAMRNKGVEFLLNHRNTLGGLYYDVSFNTSYNRNTVERFPNPARGSTIRIEGESWDSFYGYEHIGFHQTDEAADSEPHIVGAPVAAGDLKFKDQNNDGIIDGDDRVVLGNSIPEITYGIGLNLEYKGFDFSTFLQGAERVYRTLGGVLWPFSNGGSALEMNLDRTIVKDGKVVQEGTFPRVLTTGFHQHNNQMSSFSVFDASYLRMKNLQLGYTLPITVIEKVRLSRARVYISGQNLFTITEFPRSFDPEVTGPANYSYPQVKFYMIGLNLTF